MPKKPIRRIRIDGKIAYVPLTQGYEAMIDTADVPIVARWNWQIKSDRGYLYAYRKGKSGNIWMHRLIMGNPKGMVIDHINRDGLDNRRGNLRIATHAENIRNQGIRKNNTSGIKGVSLVPSTGRWQARIMVWGQAKFLGTFATSQEAHAAYVAASRELHGEFGNPG
jgi:hypothetical protein